MNRAETLSHAKEASYPGVARASLEELEDALYDILASGVDPDAAPGTLEAVQLFLHEHARSRKSQAEMLGFFEQHGVIYAPEGARSLSPALALPLVEGYELPSTSTSSGGTVPAEFAPILQPHRVFSGPWAWLGAACVLALLGAGVAAGYAEITDMRAELKRVRAESAEHAVALGRVTADANTLRARVRDNAEWMRTVDQKSELLLQTFASPLDPAGR